jgi:hypothetical protein
MFYLLHNIQTVPGPHPKPYSVGTEELSSGVKRLEPIVLFPIRLQWRPQALLYYYYYYYYYYCYYWWW